MQCNEADRAFCLLELAEAAKGQNLVFRKVGPSSRGRVGSIEYNRKKDDETDKAVQEGYYLTECDLNFDDEDGDPTPFWEKGLPFDPNRLRNICGDRGYGRYVDIPAEDPEWEW